MTSLHLIVFVLAGMSLAEAQTNQLPTATEIFNLRSLCTSLGEKLLQENVSNRNLYSQTKGQAAIIALVML